MSLTIQLILIFLLGVSLIGCEGRRGNLRTFLKRTRSRVDLVNKGEACGDGVTVVMGNEAVDLDSAASALSYAYLLSETKGKGKGCTFGMLNTNANEFHTKTEVEYAINHFVNNRHKRRRGNSKDILIFRDTIDLEKLHQQKRLNLYLVDHNTLSDRQKDLASSVRGIVDHHAVTKYSIKTADYTNIHKVGSCSTLVAGEFLTASDNYHGHARHIFPHDAALLLYSAILIDTKDLTHKTKTTPTDISTVNKIAKDVLHLPSPDEFRKKVYSDVKKSKSDVSKLSPLEILNKDVKVRCPTKVCVLMASVIVPVQYVLDKMKKSNPKQSFSQLVQELGKKNKADIVSVVFRNDPKYEWAFYSANPQLWKKAMDALKNSEIDIGFKPMKPEGIAESPEIGIFEQTGRGASRKKTLPLMERTFAKKKK